MFKGSIPALVTPFTATGAVDEAAFVSHVEWQIAEGSHGLVPVGTTGESPTLSHVEHKRVVELCIETAAGRVPVIAGAGSNNTREAIELAQHAEKAGADAILVVTPYYNKPTQKGLFAHYAAIAESVKLPIVIYNIPGRSVVDMSVGNHGRTAQGVSVDRRRQGRHRQDRARFRTAHGLRSAVRPAVRARMRRRSASTPMVASGCISVTANVAPRLCAEFQEATLAGDYAKALEYQDKLMPLHKAIFMEPGLCGAKYALNRLRQDEPRGALAAASDA